MQVYKIVCIDVQHAIIAAARIDGMGYRAIRLGRAVLTDAEMKGNVPSVIHTAMARTTEPTESDMKVWSETYEA